MSKPSDAHEQAANPYLGLHYAVGMVMGCDDFEDQQAYHRGKSRLHNAWLHREGVVWGLGVQLNAAQSELLVSPGLALDSAGHELHLDAAVCVALNEWFEQQCAGELSAATESEGPRTFDAHVVASFRAALTRPVPVPTEPGEDSDAGMAYSRVFETIEISLVPGRAPAPAAGPNHRVRVLCGLDAAHVSSDGSVDAADQAVLDGCAHVASLPPERQPQAWLGLFRQLAAADSVDVRPAADSVDGEGALRCPAVDSAPLVLAEIRGLALRRQGNQWFVSGGSVHNDVRTALLPTHEIQELLCAALLRGPAGEDAGGPRIDRASVSMTGARVTFTVNRDLAGPSVTPAGFSVSSYDSGSGWKVATISGVQYDAATRAVTVTVSAALGGQVQRVVVFGTGPTPVLGADLVPLAGALTDPPAGAHGGRDFVFMRTVR